MAQTGDPPRPDGVPADSAPGGEAELNLLLSRLDQVAQLYRDAALEFSCRETIIDTAQGGARHQLEYLYVYDEKQGFQDYRTPGRKSAAQVRLQDLGLDLVLSRSYSWVFIFLGGAQKYHRYEIVGWDTRAVQLRFEPIPPYHEGLNDWFGTAWIDRETLQLLEVEAMKPEDWEVQQEFERKLAEASRSSPHLRKERYILTGVSTEFSVEKNGMRFPGRTHIFVVRRRIRGGVGDDRYHEREIRAVQQVYTDYQFFSVRTRQEIRKIIFGQGAPIAEPTPKN